MDRHERVPIPYVGLVGKRRGYSYNNGWVVGAGCGFPFRRPVLLLDERGSSQA